MYIIHPPLNNRRFSFNGEGKELFYIFFKNLAFCILTLGLYWPWAKANKLRYLYEQTFFEGKMFLYQGRAIQMFWGMFKTLALVLLPAIALVFLFYTKLIFFYWLLPFYFFWILMLVPLAFAGSIRYHLANSVYNHMHFYYDGSNIKLLQLWIKGFFLSLITLGIYTPWFIVDLLKELAGNTYYGQLHFKFEGDAKELWGRIILGLVLCCISFGIYFFWWRADLHNYIVNRVLLVNEANNERDRFYANAKGAELMVLIIGNLFMLIFSLGLAYPWVFVRSFKYFLSKLCMSSNINLNQVGGEHYSNKKGHGMLNQLNLQGF